MGEAGGRPSGQDGREQCVCGPPGVHSCFPCQRRRGRRREHLGTCLGMGLLLLSRFASAASSGSPSIPPPSLSPVVKVEWSQTPSEVFLTLQHSVKDGPVLPAATDRQLALVEFDGTGKMRVIFENDLLRPVESHMNSREIKKGTLRLELRKQKWEPCWLRLWASKTPPAKTVRDYSRDLSALCDKAKETWRVAYFDGRIRGAAGLVEAPDLPPGAREISFSFNEQPDGEVNVNVNVQNVKKGSRAFSASLGPSAASSPLPSSLGSVPSMPGLDDRETLTLSLADMEKQRKLLNEIKFSSKQDWLKAVDVLRSQAKPLAGEDGEGSDSSLSEREQRKKRKRKK